MPGACPVIEPVTRPFTVVTGLAGVVIGATEVQGTAEVVQVGGDPKSDLGTIHVCVREVVQGGDHGRAAAFTVFGLEHVVHDRSDAQRLHDLECSRVPAKDLA